MPFSLQLLNGRGWQVRFHRKAARTAGAGIEGAGEMLRMEQWLIDRLLQVQPVMDMAQEEDRLPLVLLVAARRAEGDVGLAVAERHRRRQRGARTLARRQTGRQSFLQPEHLGTAGQAETQLRNDRRAL